MAAPLGDPLLRTIRSGLSLLRPINLAGIALAAWVGARLAQAPVEAATILVPVLIGAYGYARNDAADLDADRINRPDRPLPSGALSTKRANAIGTVALLLAALLVGWMRSDLVSLAIAVGATALLSSYSPWLKDRGALGPASIALLTVLAVAWGAVGGMAPERALLPGLLAGSAQFARECVKELEDAGGDREAGRRTWAVSVGAVPVTLAARIAILGALLLLPLPATTAAVRPIYLAVALPTAGILLVGAFVSLRGPAPPYGRVSAMLKLVLFSGMAALLLGA